MLSISRYSLHRLVQAGSIRTVRPLRQIRYVAEDCLKRADPDQTSEKVIWPHEAGRLLGVRSRTVNRMCRAGTLPAVRTPGGRFRVLMSGVTQFLKLKGVSHVGSVEAAG